MAERAASIITHFFFHSSSPPWQIRRKRGRCHCGRSAGTNLSRVWCQTSSGIADNRVGLLVRFGRKSEERKGKALKGRSSHHLLIPLGHIPLLSTRFFTFSYSLSRYAFYEMCRSSLPSTLPSPILSCPQTSPHIHLTSRSQTPSSYTFPLPTGPSLPHHI
jgi:hypothetical protein